jgi:hypothetical protein
MITISLKNQATTIKIHREYMFSLAEPLTSKLTLSVLLCRTVN